MTHPDRKPLSPSRRASAPCVAAVLAAVLATAGCASDNPWLEPRSPAPVTHMAPIPAPRAAPSPAARTAPVRTSPTARPLAPTPTPAAASLDRSALDAEEDRLFRRIHELKDARSRIITLLSAARTLEEQPSPAHAEAADRALLAYKESPAVRKFGAVAFVLSLTSCSSIGREISSLNAQERDIATQISVLQEARKANIALVTALQQVQRDGGTAKSEATLDRARASYAAAISRVED